MSDEAMDFLDLIGSDGPCFHCGTDHTPLWRRGPPEKPVLCNACGSRWKAKGTLEDYAPKHGIKDTQSGESSKSSSQQNPLSSDPTIELKQPQHGSNIVGHDYFSYFYGDGTTTANEAPLWDPYNVSRRKRSLLEQHALLTAKTLHQQLYIAHHGSESAAQTDDKEDNAEDVVIFERVNPYIPENEIGLGCMLLKPPSPAKDSNSDSPPATFPIKEPNPQSSAGFQSLVPPKEVKPESPLAFTFHATPTTKSSKLSTAGGSSLADAAKGKSSE